eukprot:361649-Chlamydomonas_euryale.AAC.2
MHRAPATSPGSPRRRETRKRAAEAPFLRAAAKSVSAALSPVRCRCVQALPDVSAGTGEPACAGAAAATTGAGSPCRAAEQERKVMSHSLQALGCGRFATSRTLSIYTVRGRRMLPTRTCTYAAVYVRAQACVPTHSSAIQSYSAQCQDEARAACAWACMSRQGRRMRGTGPMRCRAPAGVCACMARRSAGRPGTHARTTSDVGGIMHRHGGVACAAGEGGSAPGARVAASASAPQTAEAEWPAAVPWGGGRFAICLSQNRDCCVRGVDALCHRSQKRVCLVTGVDALSQSRGGCVMGETLVHRCTVLLHTNFETPPVHGSL